MNGLTKSGILLLNTWLWIAIIVFVAKKFEDHGWVQLLILIIAIISTVGIAVALS